MSDTAQFVAPLLVELAGDIDFENADAIAAALCEAIDVTSDGLLIDISAVPFMDSCAIAMMVRVHVHGTKHGCCVTWRGIRAAPARVVDIAGLTTLFILEPECAPISSKNRPVL